MTESKQMLLIDQEFLTRVPQWIGYSKEWMLYSVREGSVWKNSRG